MKYLITLFWALIFGQVIGYISSALSGGATNFKLMFFLSLFFAVVSILMVKIAVPAETKQK